MNAHCSPEVLSKMISPHAERLMSIHMTTEKDSPVLII